MTIHHAPGPVTPMASLGISRTDRTPATAIETAARRHIDHGAIGCAAGCPARAADLAVSP